MLFSGLVVEKGLGRQRFLNDGHRHPLDARRLREITRELERG